MQFLYVLNTLLDEINLRRKKLIYLPQVYKRDFKNEKR